MSKHSIRIGSDSRLSASRSSSSASTRRSRFVSATNVSERERELGVLLRELLQPPLLAALRRAHLDARAAQLGEERLQRARLAEAARHEHLRRDRRRRAVVLEAELLEHLGDLLAGRVLEVERVAVDHPPVAEREDLHGRAVRADRDADHVDRPDRAGARPPAARPAARPRAAGCGSAPRPRTAPRPRPRASAARARAGSAGRRPRGTRSRRRSTSP